MSGDVRELLDAAGLSRIADAVERLALPSVRLTARIVDEADLPLGASKIGGSPDLPPGWAWPDVAPVVGKGLAPFPLGFVAQLNMAEVASHDAAKELPDSGMLYFFFDDEHHFDSEQDYPRGWKVLYYGGDRHVLRRVPPPPNLPARGIYRARALTFSAELCLPHYAPYEPATIERLGLAEGLTEDEYEAYWRVQERLAGTEAERNHVIHRLLGHAEPIQDDVQFDCQREANGAQSWNDPHAEVPKAGAADWRLLLQIDTDDDGDSLIWGDCGRIYYLIRQRDLQRRDFSNVWLILQCF